MVPTNSTSRKGSDLNGGHPDTLPFIKEIISTNVPKAMSPLKDERIIDPKMLPADNLTSKKRKDTNSHVPFRNIPSDRLAVKDQHIAVPDRLPVYSTSKNLDDNLYIPIQESFASKDPKVMSPLKEEHLTNSVERNNRRNAPQEIQNQSTLSTAGMVTADDFITKKKGVGRNLHSKKRNALPSVPVDDLVVNPVDRSHRNNALPEIRRLGGVTPHRRTPRSRRKRRKLLFVDVGRTGGDTIRRTSRTGCYSFESTQLRQRCLDRLQRIDETRLSRAMYGTLYHGPISKYSIHYNLCMEHPRSD
jgi:hypothetical protein